MESKIIIRKGVAGDAEQIIQHTKTVLQENPFVMGTTLEEFSVSVEEEREWINSHAEKGLLLVAEAEGQIIGLLNFKRSSHKKFSQNGTFSMSIQEKYTNNGIGSLLMNELLKWAKKDHKQGGKDLFRGLCKQRSRHSFISEAGFSRRGQKEKACETGNG